MWGTEGDCIIEIRSFVKWIAESSWLADRRLRVLLAAGPGRRRPRHRPGRGPLVGHGSPRRRVQAFAILGYSGRAAAAVAAGPERCPRPGCAAARAKTDRGGRRIFTDALRVGRVHFDRRSTK